MVNFRFKNVGLKITGLPHLGLSPNSSRQKRILNLWKSSN